MKKLATKIFVSMHDSIRDNKPLTVCVGEIELLLKKFDENVKKCKCGLDENGESVTQQK